MRRQRSATVPSEKLPVVGGTAAIIDVNSRAVGGVAVIVVMPAVVVCAFMLIVAPPMGADADAQDGQHLLCNIVVVLPNA